MRWILATTFCLAVGHLSLLTHLFSQDHVLVHHASVVGGGPFHIANADLSVVSMGNSQLTTVGNRYVGDLGYTSFVAQFALGYVSQSDRARVLNLVTNKKVEFAIPTSLRPRNVTLSRDGIYVHRKQ